MVGLAVDLSRSLATTRIPADAFCLLADLLDFVPLHANGLPGPDVQRIGHLFKGDRVADAAYLKFSGTNHSPYQQFFNGGPAGRQRVQEARDAIAAFKKVRIVRTDLPLWVWEDTDPILQIVSKPRSRRAFHERPAIEQSWEHVAQCVTSDCHCLPRCTETNYNQIALLRDCPGDGHARISLHCLREWLPHL
jgi:hypothetical protein